MEENTNFLRLRSYTLKEIAAMEGKSYNTILSAKKRGDYVEVTSLHGRDLSGRSYETKLAKERGSSGEPVKWSGKDGRRELKRYLNRNDSKAVLPLFR